MLFASTLNGLSFKWFEGMPEGSIATFQDLQIASEKFHTEMESVIGKTLLEEWLKPNEPVKEYLSRWQTLALQCHEMEPRTKYDICKRNIATKFQKYFVSVKPNSFAQIPEIAQSAEVVMARDSRDREFFKQPANAEKGKR